MEQVAIAVISSVLTGVVASVGTIKGLHVHISYLKQNDERHDEAIKRAHERIDELVNHK